VLPALGALGGALLLGSVDVDQAVFARAEVAAGSAPPAPGEAAEPALSAELRPGAALRLRSERSSLTLRLEPRFHYRTPNLANLDRPLVLLRTDASYLHALTPRLAHRTNVSATYGEVDYLDLDLSFGDTAPTRELRDPVITRFSTDAQTGFAWQATRRYEISVDAVASYQVELEEDQQTPAGSGSPAPAIGQPETLAVGIDVIQEYELDERSVLRLPVSPRYYSVTPGNDQIAVAVDVVYRRLLEPRATLEIGAGAAFVKDVEGECDRLADPECERPEEADPLAVLPRASVGYQRVLNDASRRRSVLRLRAALETPFDPILGDLRPLASVEAGHDRELDRDWSLSFVLQAATVTTADPLADGSAESTGAATALANYRIAPWMLFDFGTRLSTRASHLAADSFELTETQVWGFCGLTVVFAASSSDHDWAL